jgi:Protein of unknown function (DUF2778)
MRSETGWRCNFADVDQALVPDARPQRLFGGAALTCVAALCAWTIASNLYGNRSDGSDGDAFAARFEAAATRAEDVAARGDKLASSFAARVAAMTPSSPAPADAYASLFDRRFSLGYSPGSFIRSAALEPQQQPQQQLAPAQATAASTSNAVVAAPATPLPPPRPRPVSVRTALLRDSAERNRAAAGTPPAEEPSIYEKLFGKPKPVALAYAAPDDAGLAVPNIVARYDRQTAVYDISAKTVYLPDGQRLEAHSGLGSFLDDPRHADLKMRGVTPSNIYDLELREDLFHGVRALRLIPEDEHKVFGRAGLLAHTFMLGPNGDSNGCVSFRNYEAFLQAYLNHKITRLAVVSSLE